MAAASAAASLNHGSSSADTRIVAAALVAGGIGCIGGYILARRATRSPYGETAESDLAEGDAAVERALKGIEDHHMQMGKMKDAHVVDDTAWRAEVHRWAGLLAGGPLRPALRLALSAQRVNFEGKVGALSAVVLSSLLRKEHVEESVTSRTCQLVAKDESLALHQDMNILEDASHLAAFSCCPFPDKLNETAIVVDCFQNAWSRLSRYAQGILFKLELTPNLVGCMIEAMASAEGLMPKEKPMSAPRLPATTIATLRATWAKVHKLTFSEEFMDRLLEECEDLQSMNTMQMSSSLITTFVQLVLDLLEPEHSERLQKVILAAAALSRHLGSVRMSHLGAIKRALTRTVMLSVAPKDKKSINRAWEALFFSLAAIAAPHLAVVDSFSQFVAATASALPLPAGGTQAAAVATQGVALLEMCLDITAGQTLSRVGEYVPPEVVTKLREARGKLLECVQSEVNAYCGLLGATYGGDDSAPLADGGQAHTEEIRCWQNRVTEVQLKVADHTLQVANLCIEYRKRIVRSLESDWLAGARLLQAAMDISMRNTEMNMLFMPKERQASLKEEVVRLREQPEYTRSVWEELSDV